MGNSIQNREMIGKIRLVISQYKQEFPQVDKQERFKWEAISWYKKHWDIEARDFAAMLKTAFQKSSVLLSSGMYYPLKMLLVFADNEPKKLRKLFRTLHNETLSLEYRYKTFRDASEAFLSTYKANNPDWNNAKQHYQDLRAILVYLTFEYPETYYFYKYSMFTKFAKRVGYVDETPGCRSQIGRVESYHRLCKIVEQEVLRDTELQNMSKGRLGDDCYKDEKFHILTMDLIFYGSIYLSEKDFDAAVPVENDSEYWPSLDEYDPGISKEMWLAVLEDESITSSDTLDMLLKMLELGGESTRSHLTEQFGGDDGHYNSLGMHFGKKVKARYNCPDCINREGDTVERNRVYVIPFVGRYVHEKGKKRYSWKLRKELKEALESMEFDDMNEGQETAKTDVGLNTILCGPPGTGKTYHTVIYAVAIIENKRLEQVAKEDYKYVLERYNRYKEAGQIAFTTFHQSYGYEEFIEGIRPDVVDESGDAGTGMIQYSVQPGVFKRFCEIADCPISVHARVEDLGVGDNATIWKVSLWGTGDNEIRTECLQNNHIRIGWDQYGRDITDETDFSEDGGKVVLNAFINKMKIGDIVFSCYSASTIDAIGIVRGEYEWHEEYEVFRRVRKVHWLVKNIRENILAINGGTSMTLASVYRLSKIAMADVFEIVNKHEPIAGGYETYKDNFVFIIDEINRGNISKIFGELITLIEESKRVGCIEGMKAVLPYSRKLFGVPENVYIIGTMNTADRSIAAIDTALRRRFQFREMLPDPDVLDGVFVEDLSIKEMLISMNKRIEVLYDREHTIGHGYFVPLCEDPSIDRLSEIFRNNIIPLLQEYFYEDYEKIRLVLGDNQKDDVKEQFVQAEQCDYRNLFGKTDWDFEDAYSYQINQDAFDNIEAYRAI